MDVEQIELLPCPFCGGDAELRNYVVDACVHCTACFAVITRIHARDVDNGVAASVSAWNTRAALTPPEGSDQNLLELAATFETCIPFLPAAGQRNIGKAVTQLRHMGTGYVLVPVEPTPEMLGAVEGACVGGQKSPRHCTSRRRYTAMLAARPEVKP